MAERWRALAGWLLAVVFCCGLAPAAAQVPPTLRLDPGTPQVAVTSGLAWFGPQPLGGISAATGGRLKFQAFDPGQPVRFAPGKSLWLRLRVAPAQGTTETWELEVPTPIIDSVSLYQQDASGRWFAGTAGDLVPRREWPQPGRYPSFRLQLRPGVPADVYLEIRNSIGLSLPLRIVMSDVHHERSRVEYLALGVLLGALVLLVLAALVRAAVLRDALYGWYAAYALVAMGAAASFTGVAAHLLWGNAPAWADAAPGCLSLLGGSLAIVVVARLSAAAARARWLGWALQGLGWLGILLAVLYPSLARGTGLALLGVHLIGVAALSLYAAAITWRRGDPVGLWMLMGAVPLSLCVMLVLARVTGLMPGSWFTDYAVAAALTIELPMLFGALNSRSHERRTVELRRIAADSQDPLTGLMKRGPFLARLRQALARFHRRGEGAAIAVIELTNHEWIQKNQGAEAAEEALLRTVIKLRRLVRDVDTTGRIGEHRFALILEGVAVRKPMAAVAARLVAAGLMEEPGRPGDSVLHIHVAAVLLHERIAQSEELLDTLCRVLDVMSPRTRRPVRFLERDDIKGAGDEDGSAVETDTGMAPA